MATKYRREIEPVEERRGRLTPWARQGPIAPRLTRRQGTFVIAVFLLSLLVIGQIGIRGMNARGTGFVLRAEGTIDRAWRDEAGQGRVALSIHEGGGKPWAAEWPVPDPYWAELAVGDRVAVLFRPARDGEGPRLLECGLVALPDAIR